MIIAREHTGRGVDDNETPAAALPEMPGEEHAIRAPELQRLRHWARDIRSVRFIVVAGHRVLHGASHIDLSKLICLYRLNTYNPVYCSIGGAMGREEAGWSGMLYDSTRGKGGFTVVADQPEDGRLEKECFSRC